MTSSAQGIHASEKKECISDVTLVLIPTRWLSIIKL